MFLEKQCFSNHLYKSILIVIIYFYTQSVIAIEKSESMESKIQILLGSHPELLVKYLESREKHHRSEHADVYPDPKFGFAYRSYPYRGDVTRDRSRPDTPGMTGNEYSIAQEIPFPGKLNLEKQIVQKDSELDRLNAEWIKNQFIRNYFETILIKTALTREIRDLESLEKSIVTGSHLESSQYSAGKSNITGTLRAFNLKEKIKDRLFVRNTQLAELHAKTSYFSLDNSSFLISEEEILKYLKGKEDEFVKSYSDELIRNSPYFKYAEVNAAKAEAEAKKEELLHYPETEVFISYMQRRKKPFLLDSGPLNVSIMDNPEFSGDLWSAGITLRIPVWSLGKSADLDRANLLKVQRMQLEKRKQTHLLETELKTSFQTWMGNKQRVENFQSSLLPTLSRNMTTSTVAYTKGDISLADTYQFLNDSIEMKATFHEVNLNRWLSLLKMLEITNSILPEEDSYEK
ncbi:TolC family protein [Leptospira sp. 201903074]|uniref:TolC family protein n=1 Tax=Leptospira abararensis TaxID=2810036 RepID=UPI0019646EC1|nr:TolC family protein [Leptospira abararensis]MBM9545433.1 TolC family protein [Leptospira abararensis]